MREALINKTVSCLIILSFFAMIPCYANAIGYMAQGNDTGLLNRYKQAYINDLVIGSHLADEGAYEKSIPYFKKAVEKNPTNIIAQYNLGYTLMQSAIETISADIKQQKLEDAEWAFQRARDLNPDLSLTYYKLGKLALIREDYQSARNYYEMGIAINPDNIGLRFNLAAIYEKLNDLIQAEKVYIEVIKINPQFVYAHNNLGLIYEQTNQLQKAEEIYREAINNVPSYNYARLNLGSLLQNQGRLDEAEKLYQEAIGYEPENPWPYLYLGNTYYRQGNYESALDCYNKAINLNPDYPTTYYLASLALQKLNRTDEALANGLHYINLAPNGAFSQEAGEMVVTLQQAKKQASGIDKP